MIYIEAPTERDAVLPPGMDVGPVVFLAGGITGCEDWQTYVRQEMTDDPVVLLNPRRADFDVTRGDSAAQQVEWEWRHLHDPRTALTLFWFPECDPTVTVQPIALFELGGALTEKRRIVVGAHPDYPRRQDILLQSSHFAPDLVIQDDLDGLIGALREELAAL